MAVHDIDWRELFAAGRWWGDWELPADTELHVRLDALALWIGRAPSEWRLSHCLGERAAAPALELPARSPEPSFEAAGVRGARYAFRRTADRLRIEPALPPRGLVVRPEGPLVIPRGEQVTVYLRLPLWLRLCVPGGDCLLDTGLQPLSDTWFGPRTGPGELCYASRLRGRLNLGDLPVDPFRAHAAIHIRNEAEAPLPVDGLRLPTPNLSLYAGADHQLWTETVLLVHEQDGEMAALDLGGGAPREAPGAALVAGPRSVPERRAVVHTFSGLFRGSFDAFRHHRHWSE